MIATALCARSYARILGSNGRIHLAQFDPTPFTPSAVSTRHEAPCPSARCPRRLCAHGDPPGFRSGSLIIGGRPE